MQQRDFYPMVAVQRIGEEYEPKIDKAPQNVNNALTQGSEIAHVHELMYRNLDNTAHGEWANLVKSKSKTEQAQLARYAFNNQQQDLNVQAIIAGKLWDHPEGRFSLVYNGPLKRCTSGKGIPRSYAMVIARQESAWNPKVKSPIGISGLMQITPGMATHMVKMFSIPSYSDPG